ncbi:MAG: aminotransferase [Rhizobacter sp.]|nr:aminotransferase [Rhizobacter sp.]
MRSIIENLPGSKIREVANAGIGRSDVLPFWFGESDEITPQSVREAAVASLQAGETMYAHNLGLAELRAAIASYASSMHPTLGSERIAVTSSGVNGLMIAMQLLVDAGDEVVAVVPVWPNLTAQPAILGANVKRVSLAVVDDAWTLDLPKLLDTITDRTRVLIVNAPNNPTGWTMTHDEQRAVLEHCRRTGTWILADEVYERLYYPSTSAASAGHSPAAPSFLDIAAPDDRLIVAQSFSKSFLMTGWRLGYLVVPASVCEAVGKLIEFNTSCAPVFVQRAGIQALEDAATTVPALVAKLRRCRDTLLDGLLAVPGVHVAMPQGGMYAFFRMEGESDSMRFAKRLVAEAGLGLAPGAAFGDEAEGWLRWCFASRDPSRLTLGVERLVAATRQR